MADQRLIGDILSERRRSLGLSVDRVVNDTKLQRRMVEAFEQSDFDAMPPRGYAQASLASYARYLGLNPNEVLRVYEDQLYDFQREMGMGARPSGRARTEGRPSSTRARSVSTGYGDMTPVDRYDRDPRYDDRYAGRREASRGFEAYEQDVPARYQTDRSRSNAARSVDRGLYDSGYRRNDRSGGARAGLYASERPFPDRQDRRDPYVRGDERGYQYDAASANARGVSRIARDGRREMQVVMLDDGYQGGSGGTEPYRYDPVYQTRVPQRSPQDGARQSVSEVLLGFYHSIRSDRRTFVPIVCTLVIVVAIVLAVAFISCTRSGDGDGPGGNVPVTSMTDQGGAAVASSTALQSSVDLNSVPPNSILALTVNADALAAPWIEARVDDVAVYASITQPGHNEQWTITRNAELRLSSAEDVYVTVNGTQVTPILETGTNTFVLSVKVPEDQWPQDAAVV